MGDRISVTMGFNLGMYITSLCFICYGKIDSLVWSELRFHINHLIFLQIYVATSTSLSSTTEDIFKKETNEIFLYIISIE